MCILEQATLDKIQDKDIIDVGGFIGDSAIIFEREFTRKKVHSFEATKTNYNLMLKTLELNNAKRIIPINKGLGAKEESLEISVIGSGSTMNESVAKWYGATKIEQTEIITLDSYVEKHNIEVGFIKVDIEGFEQEFLKGAMETIKTQKPAMLISIYHNADDFFNIKPLIESWDLGYRFKIHRATDGNSFSVETALYCEVVD